jgi:O-6-methylguanine DNA methyltransferase
MKSALIELPVKTDEGEFLARYSAAGLVALNFPKAKPSASPRHGGQRPPIPANILRWHRFTELALNRVLAGRHAKQLPPLDWAGATEFQQAVWRAMLAISSGQTKSYGEVAAAIGRPKALRAVGGACGANPIPVLVPCHRVLAANRQLGGFSGGLEWKRRLLAREGGVV